MAKNALPAPDDDGSDGEPTFSPILKAPMIGKVGTKAKLAARGKVRAVSGQYGDQVMIEVLYKRKVYDLAIKQNSPNYRFLFERFGANPKKWKGVIPVEIANNGNPNDYIRILNK